ncbi:MAG: DUF86 domain-containing protein [bacterium]
MSFSVIEYLRHILDETEYIIDQVKSLHKEEFVRNGTLIRAFVRSLEIIGEATKKIPEDFRLSYPQIEWKEMAGMRDRLIHDYMGVDNDIVWDVVINKIPYLYEEIKKIIAHELKKGESHGKKD